VTARPHVPSCALSNSIVPAKRHLIRRRRPARDSRSACPNFSMTSSMAPAASADRPARDIGGPGPAAARRCRRDRRCRSRSASRNSASAADRRALACRARRWRRHRSEHVRCAFAADACARYHPRHSQHRWRALSSSSPIPRPSPKAGAGATSPARCGGQAAEVDLKTAAGWISGWPPPKREPGRQSSARGRSLRLAHRRRIGSGRAARSHRRRRSRRAHSAFPVRLLTLGLS
jgi:hypothetical protein